MAEPRVTPAIPSTGDRYIDDALCEIRDAKGRKRWGVADVRAQAIAETSRRVKCKLDALKDRIAELEAENAELVALKGGEDVVALKEEITALEAGNKELREGGKKLDEAAGKVSSHAWHLADLVLETIGHCDRVDDPIAVYNLRRAAEDVPGIPEDLWRVWDE